MVEFFVPRIGANHLDPKIAMAKWFGHHFATEQMLPFFTVHSINCDTEHEQLEAEVGEGEVLHDPDSINDDAGPVVVDDIDDPREADAVLPTIEQAEESLEARALEIRNERANLSRKSAKEARRSMKKNHVNMLACTKEITKDRMVFADNQMAVTANELVFRCHLASLEAFKTQNTTGQWHAKCATGSWQDHILEIAKLPSQFDVLFKFGVNNPNAPEGLVSDGKLCRRFATYCIELMSARYFRMARRSVPPHQFSGILHDEIMSRGPN